MHKKAKTSTFRCWMKPFWHAQKSKGFLAHRKPLVSLCPENPLSKKVLVKLRPHENPKDFQDTTKFKEFCVQKIPLGFLRTENLRFSRVSK